MGNVVSSLFGMNPYQELEQNYGNMEQMFRDFLQQQTTGLQPYNVFGQSQIPGLEEYLSNWRTRTSNFDPQASLAGKIKNYQTSDEAKLLQEKTLDAFNTAAAHSGALGGGQNLIDNAKIVHDITAGDINNYLNQLANEESSGNRYADLLTRLIGVGQNAATSQGGFIGNQSRNIAEAMGGQGAARAGQDVEFENFINSLIKAAGSQFMPSPQLF